MDTPSERTFVGCLNHRIICRHFRPIVTKFPNPRGAVMFLHGYAEYFGTDSELITALIHAGYLVFGHDHVGHGRSGGPRAAIRDVDTYVRDALTHLYHIRQSLPDIPLFILGHSMGGAIALLVGLADPTAFQGMVLLGPMIMGSPETATRTKRFLAWTLARLVPRLELTAINNDDLTKNRAVVDRFNADPLVSRSKMTVETAHALLTASDTIIANIEKINWPFLCIHGDADKLCDCKGARLLLERSSSSDKTVTIYPGSYHRVQDEPDGEGAKCIAEVVAWISERVS